MNTVTTLDALRDRLSPSDRMPLVFLGHGSPMNAIEDNAYSQAWTELGQTLPRPKAILVVSAHWMTRGTTLVDVSAMPKTIHDFYGFPEALFAQQYPAPGNPELARDVVSLLASHHAEGDDTWGLDHGAWTVLKYLYPGADVPVFQVSIDMGQGLDYQLAIGKTLSELRDRGVLILGSGNVVHNLGAVQWGAKARPHDFAVEFDQLFADRLTDRDFGALADRQGLGPLLRMAHPSVDHYLPALTIAGASDAGDDLTFMTNTIDLASISMRSFVFHAR
ncbi:4,5-DOPA dioxygenase extradiol [Tropicibacter naphthalenivorans]|uniref:LigB family dioxygenase n=1 Tax=Tropicibacter naphthalenivorans TaxID=441103 RepID=A0A0P1GG52_9RHOB|nr:4,5-DOPA dioxygenase extradiol [Tropicibacter naphthalenivorans]CUH80519.1 LigB family dioxygenase [Tropicibacter naphthalenivorans]SMC87111.1 Aromatic ring-opening dioxygenase, catalytic subunit, LigB family [Tropicibacter naphthalenivorans]